MPLLNLLHFVAKVPLIHSGQKNKEWDITLSVF